MSLKTKRIVRAVVYGVLGQVVLGYLSNLMSNFEDDIAQRLLMWNFELMSRLTGALRFVGRTPDGHPVYEPTATFFIASIAGLVLGVAVYGSAIYCALQAFDARRDDSSASVPPGA